MPIICTYELFYSLVFIVNDQFYRLKCNFCNEYWRRIYFIWPIWSSRHLHGAYLICKTSPLEGELILNKNKTVSICVTITSHVALSVALRRIIETRLEINWKGFIVISSMLLSCSATALHTSKLWLEPFHCPWLCHANVDHSLRKD